jgi:ankyrin repeat protein
MTTTTTSCQAAFEDAVRNGDARQLLAILEERLEKVNVNCFDKEGQTALHQSCLDGNLELVKMLVRFGADVRLANRDGWCPIHIAFHGGHTDIALYLVNAHRR